MAALYRPNQNNTLRPGNAQQSPRLLQWPGGGGTQGGAGSVAAAAARAGVSTQVMQDLLNKAAEGALWINDMAAVAGVAPLLLPRELGGFGSQVSGGFQFGVWHPQQQQRDPPTIDMKVKNGRNPWAPLGNPDPETTPVVEIDIGGLTVAPCAYSLQEWADWTFYWLGTYVQFGERVGVGPLDHKQSGFVERSPMWLTMLWDQNAGVGNVTRDPPAQGTVRFADNAGMHGAGFAPNRFTGSLTMVGRIRWRLIPTTPDCPEIGFDWCFVDNSEWSEGTMTSRKSRVSLGPC